MTCDDGGYAAVIRQAAHDAVHALLTAATDSAAGSQALREVTTWLAATHGAGAVQDVAEELAVDLAEAFAALAAAEGQPRPCRPRRLVPRRPRTVLRGGRATRQPGRPPRRCP